MPRLLAFTDQVNQADSVAILRDLCGEVAPGELVVVLRDRELSARRRQEMGEALFEATRSEGQLLVVSDRVDLARVLKAEGIHLPAAGMAPIEARQALASKNIWLSRAGHGADELSVMELAQLTAVVVSPVWQLRKGRAALGAVGLRKRVSDLKSRAPQLGIYALGGISSKNARESLECGADGVAAMGVLASAPERKRLLEALDIRR